MRVMSGWDGMEWDGIPRLHAGMHYWSENHIFKDYRLAGKAKVNGNQIEFWQWELAEGVLLKEGKENFCQTFNFSLVCLLS